MPRVPWAVQSILIYFMHSINSVYMSIATSQLILSPTSPFVVHMFVLYICVSMSALQIILSIAFFWIPHLSDIIPYFSLSDLHHSVWQFLGPSMSLQMALFHSYFSSVQSLSLVQLSATPWIAARQASLSITNSRSLLKPMSIESVMPSNHLILCCPLLFLPPIPPSIRVFSNESTLCMRWPKYWSFSFSISPSNEHPGRISFRMDWVDLFAVQGTLKSLLQHHSSKASIFRCSSFFTVKLSHHSYLWLSNIPLYICTMSSLSISLSEDI